MKYTIEYLTDKKIVALKMKGRLNFQSAEQYSKEAIKLAHQHYCTKFLFDHKETITPKGKFIIHATGDELQQFGFKNTDRIAIVIGNRKIVEPENRNASWSDYKYFSIEDMQKAIDWLLS